MSMDERIRLNPPEFTGDYSPILTYLPLGNPKVGDRIIDNGRRTGTVESISPNKIVIRPMDGGRTYSIKPKFADLYRFESPDSPTWNMSERTNPKRPSKNWTFAPPPYSREMGLASGRNTVQSQGTPQNRLTRRTQAPLQLRQSLSSGMERTKLIRPMNDGMREYIGERIAGRDYIKASDIAKNAEYAPGELWLLDSKKFLSLFIDEEGKQLPVEEIAKILGVDNKTIREMQEDGKGIPGSLFSDVVTAMYEGMRYEVLSKEGVDTGFKPSGEGSDYDLAAMLLSKNVLTYMDALGVKLWGFDYSPYWHDVTEERTVTALGQSKENADSARGSFLAALEDNEVLASFKPAFEPIGWKDEIPARVEPVTTPAPSSYVPSGTLIPQSSVLDSGNFGYGKLAVALGVDADNTLAFAQKLTDEGIQVSPKTLGSWRSNGVPSEVIDHLIVGGALKSAADAFGPEYASFDAMPSRADVLEQIIAGLEKSGISPTAIATITGTKYTLQKAKAEIEKAKEKAKKRKAKTDKLAASGKASKVTDAEKREYLNAFNVIAKKKGVPSLTMEELFGNGRSGGLSSGGKRFVVQTPAKRMTRAQIQKKYPNLNQAYARVSDIPTPERLNNTGLSSGREQEIYATITANLVESMEKAIAEGIEWEAPWRQGRMYPRNGMTQTRYKGINTLMLMLMQVEKGYEKPVWGTFDNWKAAGGSVKKGEKGTPIIFAGFIDVEDPKNPGETKTRRTMKQYYVFNLDQVEGVDRTRFDDNMEELDEQLRVSSIDEIATALNVDLRHAGDKAYFSPTEDRIVMPPFSEFKSAEDYYSTLMHEMVHWTGHSSRLGRPNMNQFGSPEYAFEELIAELGAAYMMSILGLAVQPRGDHAHYLGHWVQKLKEDPEAIQKAATAAQKAVNHIIENVPSLKEATEKANAAAKKASEEAKKLSDEAKEARGAASTSRRPNTRRPSTRRRQ